MRVHFGEDVLGAIAKKALGHSQLTRNNSISEKGYWRGKQALPVVSSHPFVEDELQPLCGNTAVELSKVALHGTPNLLNVVGAGEVSFGMVPAFME